MTNPGTLEGMKRTPSRLLDLLFIGILFVVFGGIVLHAPISVGFSTVWPEQSLIIKSWKEILLGIAAVLATLIISMRGAWGIFKSRLFYLIAGFAALNLLLIPLYFTGVESTIAGLFINLRYLLFFVLVYAAIRLYPHYYRWFIGVFVAGALVVTVFAVLQATVLPYDILKYLGYGESTIMPYLTVDQNYDYIRINSTLRGPNPLGAYAAIVLVVALAAWLRGPRVLKQYEKVLLVVLGVGSIVALWASYSRSAALAALAGIGIVLLVTYGRRISKGLIVAMGLVALVVCGSLIALRDTQFVSQVVLHEDPEEGNDVNSNDGHYESLLDGTNRMVNQPLGAGIGSTGSASLLGDKPLIIENQYLFIAHETGWPGVVLFIAIQYLVLAGLWVRRKHWLALGVFASGVGLAAIALIQPVWVDETVALIWWGLAAIALAMPLGVKKTDSVGPKKANPKKKGAAK